MKLLRPNTNQHSLITKRDWQRCQTKRRTSENVFLYEESFLEFFEVVDFVRTSKNEAFKLNRCRILYGKLKGVNGLRLDSF